MVEWKRSLWSIELTGGRRTARTAMLAALIAVASLSIVLLLLEAHRVYEGPSHSLLGENPWPLAVLVVPAVVAILALSRGMATGLLAGFLALGAAIIAFGILVLVHLLSLVVENTAGDLLMIALLALAALGPVTMIGELVVRVLERRRLEATDPVFATARVVE